MIPFETYAVFKRTLTLAATPHNASRRQGELWLHITSHRPKYFSVKRSWCDSTFEMTPTLMREGYRANH